MPRIRAMIPEVPDVIYYIYKYLKSSGMQKQ